MFRRSSFSWVWWDWQFFLNLSCLHGRISLVVRALDCRAGGCGINCGINRPFAWWRYFTTMTSILQGFAFLRKLGLLLFKPHWDYQIKYEKKTQKNSGLSSKMTPSCKWRNPEPEQYSVLIKITEKWRCTAFPYKLLDLRMARTTM